MKPQLLTLILLVLAVIGLFSVPSVNGQPQPLLDGVSNSFTPTGPNVAALSQVQFTIATLNSPDMIIVVTVSQSTTNTCDPMLSVASTSVVRLSFTRRFSDCNGYSMQREEWVAPVNIPIPPASLATATPATNITATFTAPLVSYFFGVAFAVSGRGSPLGFEPSTPILTPSNGIGNANGFVVAVPVATSTHDFVFTLITVFQWSTVITPSACCRLLTSNLFPLLYYTGNATSTPTIIGGFYPLSLNYQAFTDALVVAPGPSCADPLGLGCYLGVGLSFYLIGVVAVAAAPLGFVGRRKH